MYLECLLEDSQLIPFTVCPILLVCDSQDPCTFRTLWRYLEMLSLK